MTRSENMEHVEVLRDLSEVCRAAIKAGDWKVDGACDPDSLLRHADAAIASLSAPQPPAEAQTQGGGEVVYFRKEMIARCREYAAGMVDIGADPHDLEAALAPLLGTAPPSAPVGVERIAAEIRASLGRGATVCTRRRWAIELEALAQQPAAVDEAMVERLAQAVATELYGEPPQPGSNSLTRAMMLPGIKRALTAALAAQQEGGTDE